MLVPCSPRVSKQLSEEALIDEIFKISINDNCKALLQCPVGLGCRLAFLIAFTGLVHHLAFPLHCVVVLAVAASPATGCELTECQGYKIISLVFNNSYEFR